MQPVPASRMSDRSSLHDACHLRARGSRGPAVMDTRSKILTLSAALELQTSVALVSGTFDVLRAEHARELGAIRDRVELPLLAVVLPVENGVLPESARARMVAALRMVDYV